MSDERPIPDAEWWTIVTHDDGIVLGKRTNDLAKGEWFPSGDEADSDESRSTRELESQLGWLLQYGDGLAGENFGEFWCLSGFSVDSQW